MPYKEWYPFDFSVLHAVAHYCGFSPHHFLCPSQFLRLYPPLVITQSLRKNNAFHRVCWFNLPPVTPWVLIPALRSAEALRYERRGGGAGDRMTDWDRDKGREENSESERRKMVATSLKFLRGWERLSAATESLCNTHLSCLLITLCG